MPRKRPRLSVGMINGTQEVILEWLWEKRVWKLLINGVYNGIGIKGESLREIKEDYKKRFKHSYKLVDWD